MNAPLNNKSSSAQWLKCDTHGATITAFADKNKITA